MLPFVVVFSGGALPLVVIFIFVGCFCTAWLLGEMSGKLPSSGGMLTFIANGLGPDIGFVAGWFYVLCLLVDVAGIYLLLAGFVAAQLHASWNWNTTAVWIIVTIALAAFVTFNGLRQASRGTRLGAILGTIEVLVFAILSIWLIFAAGSRNTLQVFSTHFANAPGYHGISGIIAAAVLTILAYQGFESAVVLGEEAKQPRVSVKNGMLLSVAGILVYFVLATYASTVYFGPGEIPWVRQLWRWRALGPAGSRRLGRRLGDRVPGDRELGDRLRQCRQPDHHPDSVRYVPSGCAARQARQNQQSAGTWARPVADHRHSPGCGVSSRLRSGGRV